jgi:hypothetical protein
VRHPGQLDRERVGQPHEVDLSRAVAGDRRPVLDARADDRAAPNRGQVLAEPADRVGTGDRAMRHSTLSTTTEIYGHLLRHAAHQAVDAIDLALTSAESGTSAP